jgi:hypothetical protein
MVSYIGQLVRYAAPIVEVGSGAVKRTHLPSQVHGGGPVILRAVCPVTSFPMGGRIRDKRSGPL